MPLNFRIGHTEIPLGLILITTAPFVLALINVVTKKTATISGSIFTVGFFAAFALSERQNRQKHLHSEAEQEKFRLEEHQHVSTDSVHVRQGSILVEASNPNRLDHLTRVLQDVNPAKQDVVVLAVHRLPFLGSGEYRLDPTQICGDREVELFTKVVSVAEKAGKHVELLTLPGRDEPSALVMAAQQLGASRIVMAPVPTLTPDEQARLIGQAWEQLPAPRPALTVEIIPVNGPSHVYSLGPHQPRLWPSDVNLVHQIWQELADRPGVGGRLHHRDIVSVALRRFEQQLHSKQYPDVVADVERELQREHRETPQPAVDSVGAPHHESDGRGLA